jgi:RHS repeat-associated protein
VSETVYNLDDTVQSAKRAVGTALAQTYASYTYTNNGLVASEKDAKNNLTAHSYDGHDRKLKTQFPSPTAINTASTTDYEQYGWDESANLTSLRKRSGQSITLAYDNLGRLLSRTYPVSADNVAYTYDLLGRRLTATGAVAADNVSYAYDNAGRLSTTTAGTRVIAYQYDAAGNRTRMTWPDTAFFVTTAYDALNRPTVLKENDTVNLAGYAYDDLSRRTTVTLGNGTTTAYGYDAQTSLASLSHNLAGTAQDQTYGYTRNQAREIATHSWSNDLYQWAGVPGNATNGTRNYSANGLNQYTAAAGSAVTHDANGNLTGNGTWTYGYDQNNRLRTASKSGTSAALAYDAEGRLRQSVVTDGTATTLNKAYDGVDLVAEYDAGEALQRRWVHGPGVDEPLVAYEGAGTTAKSWLYADHLGSIVATADATGTNTAIYSYGPYGEPSTMTGQRFRYTGQQLIGGLDIYYYKARFYDPKLGRFLQTDPIGTQDDMNLYAYVGGNPMNRTDPTGLYARSSMGSSSSVGGSSSSGSMSASSGSTLSNQGDTQVNSSGSVQLAQLLPLPLYVNPYTAVPAAIGTACMLSSGCRNLIFNEGGADSGDKDASTPTGQRGSPMNVPKGTNDPTTIGDRDYTGHSLDQMQGRGVPPAAVEDTIQNGSSRPDKDYPGSRTEHRSPDGRVVVITDTGSGRVITVQTR